MTDEQKVMKELIKRILAKGWVISVNDGEEWVVKKSVNKEEIFKAMASTDADYLKVRTGEAEGFTTVGTIVLVYGNEPYELVNDWGWSDKQEPTFGFNAFMEDFSTWLEKFERQ